LIILILIQPYYHQTSRNYYVAQSTKAWVCSQDTSHTSNWRIAIKRYVFIYFYYIIFEHFSSYNTELNVGKSFNYLLDDLPSSLLALTIEGKFNKPLTSLPPQLRYLFVHLFIPFIYFLLLDTCAFSPSLIIIIFLRLFYLASAFSFLFL
jgi:hypothetical protein